MKKQSPDNPTKSFDYNGRLVRFRKVEGRIYVPVYDITNLLQLGYGQHPVKEFCYTGQYIAFSRKKGKKAEMAIEPSDLERFVTKIHHRLVNENIATKIAWVREVAKQLLAEEHTPETALQIFQNPEFGEVRVMKTDDESLFCLADICKAVGIANARNVKSRLDADDVRQMDTIDSMGRNQVVTFVTESGLYDTLLRSDSPNARPFRKWVTKEVLPSIRRTGGYIAATPDDSPEVIMARGLMAAHDALDRMEKRALIAEQQVLLTAPKVSYYDEVVTNRDTYSTYEIAGELGTTYPTLREKLFKAHIIVSNRGVMTPTAEYANCMVLSGTNKRNTSMRWTKEGRALIFDVIAPNMPK